MAFDKVIDSAMLDAGMIATANTIREKTGQAGAIPWENENGFSAAVAGIQVGGGGSSAIYSGSFTPAENLLEVTIDVGAAFTHFVLEATKNVFGYGVKATQTFAIDNALKYGTFVSTNNAGASLSAGAFDASGGRYGTSIGNSYVEITGNTVFATCETRGACLGYFISGVTYKWYAW